MTPAAFSAWTKGYICTQKENDERMKAWIYCHASLVRSAVWGRRMPDYEQIFARNRRNMSDEEMYESVLALNAMIGGKKE